MSLLDTASLIVTPNGYKEGKLYSVIPSDGSGDLSVTRATTATRVNSQGLVELVPYNILQRSQEFNNSAWWSTGTITPNATTAPDGTMTADRVQFSSGSSNYLYQGIGNAYDGKVVTISCYLKGVTAQNIGFSDGSAYPNQISITTEWQRYTFTFTFVGGGIQIDNYFGVSPSAQAKDFYIWGAQIVEGSVAKDYQKTETRLNIPRLDYSNGTCPSILVEPQRTNLLTYSSSFNTNLPWQSYGSAVITANNATSPDGTMNADKVSVDGVYNTQLSFTSNTTYSLSIFIKKDTATSFGIGYVDTSGPFTGGSIFYNFATEVISVNQSPNSSVSGTAENYGNGWIRLIMKFTTNASSNYNYIETNYIGGSGWVWGAQLEAGSYATSYIPTTSASVTRNADVISKTGISSLIGQTEGTLFIDTYIDNIAAQTNDPVLIYLKGTSAEVYIEVYDTGGVFGIFFDGSSVQGNIFANIGLTNGRHKMAFGYKNNDFVLYIDGVQVGTDTSGTVSGSLTEFGLQYYQDFYRGAQEINSAALWKTRLTNAQLATLTTI